MGLCDIQMSFCAGSFYEGKSTVYVLKVVWIEWYTKFVICYEIIVLVCQGHILFSILNVRTVVVYENRTFSFILYGLQQCAYFLLLWF